MQVDRIARMMNSLLRTKSIGSLRPSSAARFNSTLASSAYTNPSSSINKAIHQTPDSLSTKDRNELESMLRVDHAGEIAANTIYQAQAEMFRRLGDHKTSRMMEEMWDTEKKHLQVAKQLLAQHKVRPSAFLPVWSLAGTVLGGATALMGKEAAMACTEAVETVIGEHYDDQLVHLSKWASSPPSQSSESTSTTSNLDSSAPTTSSSEPHPSLPLLEKVITEFRDDELEHLDTAVEHDAQQAPAHALLSAVVGWGCKGAIQVAKRF